jgi:UDP-N-acetyl-2-amino-2-deoxyglucuronate dehydrogenase
LTLSEVKRRSTIGKSHVVTFRVGLVGTGNISETHARAAVEAPDVELVAHWGRNPVAARRLAERYGGQSFEDLEEMLGQRDLDAVLIGTPSGAHAEFAIAAARKGLHVLVEKPLEISTTRIDAVLEERSRAGVTLGVFFQDRTAPDLVWLEQAIDAGSLGTPLLASASVRWYRPPEYYAGSAWRGTPELDGGGALMNQGIHTVDLLLWLFGPVRRVSAVAATALHDIAVEDTIVATLEFTNGALGTLEVTTAAYPGLPRRIELTGSGGTVVVEGDRVATVGLRGAIPPRPAGDAVSTNASASSPVVSDVRGHRRVIEDFVAAVREGRAPRCDGAEGRRSVALVEAIYRSARSGGPVEL